MSEPIFNLFLFVSSGKIIYELGVVSHNFEGTDKQKLSFLAKQVSSDFLKAKKFPVPKRYQLSDVETGKTSNGIRYQSYITMASSGMHLDLFEEIFEALNAPPQPLMCITPIVNGKPKFDKVDRT